MCILPHPFDGEQQASRRATVASVASLIRFGRDSADPAAGRLIAFLHAALPRRARLGLFLLGANVRLEKPRAFLPQSLRAPFAEIGEEAWPCTVESRLSFPAALTENYSSLKKTSRDLRRPP